MIERFPDEDLVPLVADAHRDAARARFHVALSGTELGHLVTRCGVGQEPIGARSAWAARRSIRIIKGQGLRIAPSFARASSTR